MERKLLNLVNLRLKIVNIYKIEPPSFGETSINEVSVSVLISF